MTDKGLHLSVIIVNWNVCDLLRACLRSVIEQMQLPAEQYEIIVLDNASQDNSVDMLRAEFPEVTLITSEENLGFGKGCNRAYEISSGEFVLLLNPDTVIQDHAIDFLLAEMAQHPKLGAIGCRMVDEQGNFRRDSGGALPTLGNIAGNYLFLNKILPAVFKSDPLFLEGDPQGRFDIQWVSGADLLFRREAVGEQIFDEAFFMFGEDMELCDRIARTGWDVVYTSAVTIIHHHGRSFEKQSSYTVLQNVHKGPRLFFQKYHGRFATAIYDLILLTGFLLRWPMYGLASLLKPGRDYDKLSAFSRQYILIMLRLFLKKADG